MQKHVLRAALFLTVFVVLFSGLTILFIPKNNSSEAGIYDAHAKAFIAEPRNSMDVLFIGDSKAYCAFVPMQLWEKYGITSYVCATSNQPTYQSYAFAKRFFQYHTPRIVILETSCLLKEYEFGDVAGHIAEEYFPYLRYHDRWKNLYLSDFTDKPDQTYLDTAKGYRATLEAEPADVTGYMTPSEEIRPIPQWSQWYVRLIRDFCEKNNAQLYLVSTASTVEFHYPLHNGIAQLAEKLNIPYVDTNLMQKAIPLDWDKDTYDIGYHLNYYGGCKTTDYIGSMLWETGLFSDKRTDSDYAQWNVDLQKFMESILEGEEVLAE